MIKSVKPRVWAFDMEWVPDPLAGQLVHRMSDELSEPEVIEKLYKEGGATEEEPRPFLKTSVCRIVSVAAVERRFRRGEPALLRLVSLPHDPDSIEERREASVVGSFLDGLSEHRPQLIGYNSRNSDLPILLQRGLILGLSAPGFCERPGKPWEGIDYFVRSGEWHVDLKDILSGWGKASPSLHELSSQSGIPGKMEVDGSQVSELWLEGNHRRIVQYNEFDALTTYLVWLRLAHFAGHFSPEAYEDEQGLVEALIHREIENGRTHLQEYLEEWSRLREIISQR